MTYQKTCIGTLNSNIESFFQNLENWPNRKCKKFGKRKKARFFGIQFSKIQHFWNVIRYLSLVSQYASLDTSHDHNWKKNHFSNFTTGHPKLWSGIVREIYNSEEEKISFEIFWPRAHAYIYNWILCLKIGEENAAP